MICEHCHERPANVVVKQSYNGQLTESHLCHVCAAENHHIQPLFDQDPLSIHQLLAHWFPEMQQTAMNPRKTATAVCPSCGFSLGKFQKVGKFGCATCYETFAPQLDEMLKRLHNGRAEHQGQVPDSFGHSLKIRREIEELKRQMKLAIEEENFETAAALRDQIRVLTSELEAGGEENGN